MTNISKIISEYFTDTHWNEELKMLEAIIIKIKQIQ